MSNPNHGKEKSDCQLLKYGEAIEQTIEYHELKKR